MFDNTIKRIGYACKTHHHDQTLPKKVLQEKYSSINTKSTTLAWMNRQTESVAIEKLEGIIEHNLLALENLINYIGSLPHGQRIVRIGSDILPFYTHSSWVDYYRNQSRRNWLHTRFSRIGEIARKFDARLSFHPGQFLVLASDNPDIVLRSLDEFEYHTDMARWMGYGQEFQDFKINIHISGKHGPEGMKQALPKLSTEARNCITIENDEMSWGLDSALEMSDDAAIVLDIHHHWVKTGEYIKPTDDRFKRIIDSWRGVRPVIHYSVSRETELPDHDVNTLPDMEILLAAGHKKQKLRAHSDYFWNRAANDWALSFLEYADIMCESKMKNLASQKLYEYNHA
jgi:UV DNA damage repair endonuclease